MKDIIDQLRWAAGQTFCEESASIVEKAIEEIRLLRLEYKGAAEELEIDSLEALGHQSCVGCYFFQDRHVVVNGLHPDGTIRGHCKRNPPVSFEDEPHGVQPIVMAEDWCGEWLPADEADED